MSLHKFYYLLKPYIPRSLQLKLRQKLAALKRAKSKDIWPIDPSAGDVPRSFPGWPGNKQFALVLSHDVDTEAGRKKAKYLAEKEIELGFRSTFNFVPERYSTPEDLRLWLVQNGFEVAVHGLIHDGKLFSSREIFQKRAKRINQYLDAWGAVGFHSPSMHRNLDWIHELNIEYDQSTFDTDPFEPQPDGVSTIFPFWVSNKNGGGYVELPYTLAQDHALFIILKEKDISIWKQKLDWIVSKGGMALLNTHPDYMNFDHKNYGREEYPAAMFLDFLNYVSSQYKNKYWHALPREIARFWRKGCLSRDVKQKTLLQATQQTNTNCLE